MRSAEMFEMTKQKRDAEDNKKGQQAGGAERCKAVEE